MAKQFNSFPVPTNISFGYGSLSQVSSLVQKYGNNVLIITGKKSSKEFGYLNRVTNFLDKKSIHSTIYDNISPEPKSNEINKGIEIAKENKVDVIIGLGGGSSIDAAKAIAVGIEYGSIESIIGNTLPKNKNALPIIAIPTTSGSGSEVTKGSIITDVNKKFKSGIRGDDVFPKEAIVDPELTLSCPKTITSYSGFDTFTHVFEGYVAKKASKLTDKYAEEALLIINEYLPKSINNGLDRTAREKMSYAAILGGVCVANASTCLPHRLQQAMGGVIDVSHGKGLATLYKSWFKVAYSYNKKRFDTVLNILGNKNSPEWTINNFMEKVSMNYSISELGAKRSDIDLFIDRISGNLENDPIENIDSNLIRKIYLDSF
tara:strand:+ start:2341 stop:3465 length:1125 start_codon:yes stop_codon:yes gene_type:complete